MSVPEGYPRLRSVCRDKCHWQWQLVSVLRLLDLGDMQMTGPAETGVLMGFVVGRLQAGLFSFSELELAMGRSTRVRTIAAQGTGDTMLGEKPRRVQ